jgi:hypothetical protein
MIIIGSTDLKTRDRFLAEEMQLQYEVNSLNFNLLAPSSEPAYLVVTVSKRDPQRHEFSCRNPYRPPL